MNVRVAAVVCAACGRAALSSFEGGWVRTAQVSLPPHSDALIPGEGHEEGVKRWLELEGRGGNVTAANFLSALSAFAKLHSNRYTTEVAKK